MKQLLTTYDDVHRTTDDGHPTITKAHHEPMAQVSQKGKDTILKQRPVPGTKFRDHNLQTSKCYLTCKYKHGNWTTWSLWGLLKNAFNFFYDSWLIKYIAKIPDPVKHFKHWTSFCDIDDVNYIPKFDYRKRFVPTFFIFHLSSKKITKLIESKKSLN